MVIQSIRRIVYPRTEWNLASGVKKSVKNTDNNINWHAQTIVAVFIDEKVYAKFRFENVKSRIQ